MKACLLFALQAMLLMGSVKAQMIADPTKWTYKSQKIGANEYQLVFQLDLKQGWHIWSIHPGGDGYQLPPTFVIKDNPKVKVKGPVTETGKAITTEMEGVTGKVTYLSGRVQYKLNVTVSGATKVTGKHSYQVCDDKMCLPPKDKDFTFDLK
jgi:hypothetical protein